MDIYLVDFRESKIPRVQMGQCKIWLCIVYTVDIGFFRRFVSFAIYMTVGVQCECLVMYSSRKLSGIIAVLLHAAGKTSETLNQSPLVFSFLLKKKNQTNFAGQFSTNKKFFPCSSADSSTAFQLSSDALQYQAVYAKGQVMYPIHKLYDFSGDLEFQWFREQVYQFWSWNLVSWSF